MTREELIELGKKIVSCQGTEAEIDEMIRLFDANVPRPNGSNLFYYPENHHSRMNDDSKYNPTVEEVVDRCLGYRLKHEPDFSFLLSQMQKALNAFFSVSNFHNVLFEIELDVHDPRGTQSNSDDIMRLWVLPANQGKLLRIEQACSMLTTYRGEVPLWIKIMELQKSRTYRLTISSRFRKKKIIKEWHRNNIYQPFLKPESEHVQINHS